MVVRKSTYYNLLEMIIYIPFFGFSECENADKALQYALLMFPGVLKPLLDELSVQTDKRVMGNAYFNSEVSGR